MTCYGLAGDAMANGEPTAWETVWICVGGGLGALAVVWIALRVKKQIRTRWTSLRPSQKRTTVFVAALALVVLIALSNRGGQDAGTLDLIESGLIIGLLLLYVLFSRAMDALWSRWTRNRRR